LLYGFCVLLHANVARSRDCSLHRFPPFTGTGFMLRMHGGGDKPLMFLFGN
jgi:hypothetical protein